MLLFQIMTTTNNFVVTYWLFKKTREKGVCILSPFGWCVVLVIMRVS